MRDWFLQRGIFDFENKKKKLDQLNLEINKKGFWDNTQYAQKVSIEASTIEKLITSLSSLENDLLELKELIELTEEENINEKDYQDYLNYQKNRANYINNIQTVEGFSNINDDFNDVLLFGLLGIFFLIFTDYIYKLGKRSY